MLLDEHERSQAEVELDIDEAKRRLTEEAREGRCHCSQDFILKGERKMNQKAWFYLL